MYIFVVNSSRISGEKSSNGGLDATPAEWTIGQGGSTRDTCGKVAAWKKHNSNLKVKKVKNKRSRWQGGHTEEIQLQPGMKVKSEREGAIGDGV